MYQGQKGSKRKEKYNESLKSSEASRTYLALNQRKRESSSQKFQMTKATQSHRGKGLQMSSANSAVNYLQAMELNKNFKILGIMNPELLMKKNTAKKVTMKKISLITEEEIQTAINKLKKGKASDNNGIRAEDINTCGNVMKERIKQIFNEVLRQESCTPETWRRIDCLEKQT